MKTRLLILLLVILCLSGCRPVETNEEKVSSYAIACSNDVSALSLIDFLDNENYNIKVLDDEVIENCFSTGAYDFIIAKTEVGVRESSKNNNYQLFAVITFGSYSLISNDTNSDKTVDAPNEEVIKKIVDENSALSLYTFSYRYSESELMDMFLNEECSRIIISEPYLTIIKEKWNETHDDEINEVYNFQSLYSDNHQYEEYPRYSLFVKSDAITNDSESLVEFGSAVKKTLSEYTVNPKKLKEKSDSLTNKLELDNYDLLVEHFADAAINFQFANNILDLLEEYLSMFDIELSYSLYVK